MFDYIGRLGEQLTTNTLIEVFGDVCLLNDTPFCRNWVPLINAVGVSGMLSLCKDLGGEEFKLPALYEVLVVYAALMVIEQERSGMDTSLAIQTVTGGIYIEGFNELLQRLRKLTDRDNSQLDIGSDA